MKSLYLYLLFTGFLFSQGIISIPAGSASIPGTSGGSVTAGTGIQVSGSTVSIDPAVTLTRATAQAGTSTYCRSTTGNDTYTCSLTPALTAYTTGSCVTLSADTSNTGAATVNINSLGAKSVLSATGSDPSVTANSPTTICYNGTNFYQVGGGSGSGTVTSVVAGPSTALTSSCVAGVCTVDIVPAYIPSKTLSNTWTGTNDFSGAQSTLPDKIGTSDPPTCVQGETFWRSDLVKSRRCVSTNTWADESGGISFVGPYLYDGSSYYLPNGVTAYRPSLLTLAWYNQGTSTVGGTNYESMVSTQGSGGIHGRVATLSNTTVEGWFSYVSALDSSGNNGPCGLTLRESSTSKIFIAGLNTTAGVPKIFGAYYTSDGTVFGGTSFQPFVTPVGGVYGLRAVLSGGTWSFYYSSGARDSSGNPAWGYIGGVAATTAFTTAANQFGYANDSPTTGGQTSTCSALSLRGL